MALTYRFYRSARIGTGARSDPFRSALTRYIVCDGTGADFWDWIHDARPLRYALARAESAVHAQIVLDVDCEALSAQFVDVFSVQEWLNELASTWPLAARTRLEDDGCSIAWATGTTRKRDVLRYLARLHVMIQELRRLKDGDSLQTFAALLDTQVQTLPVLVRTKTQQWMQNHGLAVAWITPTTTVREVIQYVMENRTWPVLTLGPVTL